MTMLPVPKTAPDASRPLWTPSELRYLQSWVVASAEGRHAVKHEFLLSYMGEQETLGVLAEEDESDALIEDMAGAMAGRAMLKIREKLQERGARILPEDLSKREHWKVRRDLAGIWRDMRKQAWKKRDMTTGKMFFAGVK